MWSRNRIKGGQESNDRWFVERVGSRSGVSQTSGSSSSMPHSSPLGVEATV